MPVETECIDCWLSMVLFSLCKHLTATIDLTSYATASVLAVPPSTTQAFFSKWDSLSLAQIIYMQTIFTFAFIQSVREYFNCSSISGL